MADKKIILNEAQLSRINHLRERAGMQPVTLAVAQNLIDRMDYATLAIALERIGE